MKPSKQFLRSLEYFTRPIYAHAGACRLLYFETVKRLVTPKLPDLNNIPV